MRRRGELLDRYASWMRSQAWAERTIQHRLRFAGRILDQWPDPGEPDTSDVVAWLAALGDSNGSPARKWTRATYHGHARAFFKWLAATQEIPADPTANDLFKRPRSPGGTPKPLSASEEAAALEAASGNTRAWLLLALRQGLRAHEIAKVRGEDVDEHNLFVLGKGGSATYLPTHPEVWELAADYPRRGWWFPSPAHDGHVSGNSVSILVSRLFDTLGIDGSIHRARHSYGTSLLRSGADMRTVQNLMRHKSIASTALYTAVDEDRLRAAINRLGTIPQQRGA